MTDAFQKAKAEAFLVVLRQSESRFEVGVPGPGYFYPVVDGNRSDGFKGVFTASWATLSTCLPQQQPGGDSRSRTEVHIPEQGYLRFR